MIKRKKLTFPDFQGRTVFVVDDSTLVRKLVCTILESEGFKVVTAEDPTKALAQISQCKSPPDLMICDICMPVMSGPELYQHIKQRFPAMPVLFITGYPGEYLNSCNVSVTEDNLLRKPFRSAELLGRVALILDTQRIHLNAKATSRSAEY